MHYPKRSYAEFFSRENDVSYCMNIKKKRKNKTSFLEIPQNDIQLLNPVTNTQFLHFRNRKNHEANNTTALSKVRNMLGIIFVGYNTSNNNDYTSPTNIEQKPNRLHWYLMYIKYHFPTLSEHFYECHNSIAFNISNVCTAMLPCCAKILFSPSLSTIRNLKRVTNYIHSPQLRLCNNIRNNQASQSFSAIDIIQDPSYLNRSGFKKEIIKKRKFFNQDELMFLKVHFNLDNNPPVKRLKSIQNLPTESYFCNKNYSIVTQVHDQDNTHSPFVLSFEKYTLECMTINSPYFFFSNDSSFILNGFNCTYENRNRYSDSEDATSLRQINLDFLSPNTDISKSFIQEATHTQLNKKGSSPVMNKRKQLHVTSLHQKESNSNSEDSSVDTGKRIALSELMSFEILRNTTHSKKKRSICKIQTYGPYNMISDSICTSQQKATLRKDYTLDSKFRNQFNPYVNESCNPNLLNDCNSTTRLRTKVVATKQYPEYSSFLRDFDNYGMCWIANYHKYEKQKPNHHQKLYFAKPKYEDVRLNIIELMWATTKHYSTSATTVLLSISILNKLIAVYWEEFLRGSEQLNEENDCSNQNNESKWITTLGMISVTAFRLACKLEEQPETIWRIPNWVDIIQPAMPKQILLDRSYQTLNEFEMKALQILDSAIQMPFELLLISYYLKCIQYPIEFTHQVYNLSVYILGLTTFGTIKHSILHNVSPSILAAGAIALAVKIINGNRGIPCATLQHLSHCPMYNNSKPNDCECRYEYFPDRLQQCCNISLEKLLPIIRGLSFLLKTKSPQTYVLKYSFPTWGEHDWK